MDSQLFLKTDRLTVRKERLATLCLIGFWPLKLREFKTHLNKTLGLPLPADGQTAVDFQGGHAFRVHHEKLLVCSRDDSGLLVLLTAGFDTSIGSLSDQSHSRILITLNGPGASCLLSRAVPLDPVASLSGVGNYVQTSLQDCNVLLHRTGPDEYQLLVPTSFSHAVEDWIKRHA